MYEAGPISSKQVYGTPMKTLLAKEMLNETSAKKRSPSLIAKLRCRDGLPSPQPLHRQQKKLSENSLKTLLAKEMLNEPISSKQVYGTPMKTLLAKEMLNGTSAKKRSPSLIAKLRCRDDCHLPSLFTGNKKSGQKTLKSSAKRTEKPFNHQLEKTTMEPHVYEDPEASNAVRHGSGGKVLKERENYRVPVSHQRNEDGHLGYSCHSNNKDMGMAGKSSTLEEMLSVPNSETRHCKTGYLSGPVGLIDEYGWRDEYLRNTSRSRSLSLSSRNQSHKTRYYHEANADVKMMVHNEPVNRGRSKVVKGKFSHTEESRSKNLRSNCKRCQSFQHCNACSHEFDNVSPTETYFKNEGPVEHDILISDLQNATTKTASVVDVFMLGDADSFAVDEDSLNSQESSTANSQDSVCIQLSGPDLESTEGSKEFGQHGQPSVLEAPLTEDVVGTELRKQLNLLKMESGSVYDSPNDEETEQRASSFTESVSENWESTYLTDLLQNSGFYKHDPYTFITTFYFVDCPIDPQLFDHLEKKYSQDPTVSRSERRLFHDRVNEAMLVLSKIMVSTPLGHKMRLIETGFEDQLQRLLAKQEKEANEEFKDIPMDKDLDWFVPVNEIEVVRNEIAEVLVNELVMEIASGWW